MQEELARTNFEGYSEDETVCITMTGNQEPVGCDITNEVGTSAGGEGLRRDPGPLFPGSSRASVAVKERALLITAATVDEVVGHSALRELSVPRAGVAVAAPT